MKCAVALICTVFSVQSQAVTAWIILQLTFHPLPAWIERHVCCVQDTVLYVEIVQRAVCCVMCTMCCLISLNQPLGGCVFRLQCLCVCMCHSSQLSTKCQLINLRQNNIGMFNYYVNIVFRQLTYSCSLFQNN